MTRLIVSRLLEIYLFQTAATHPRSSLMPMVKNHQTPQHFSTRLWSLADMAQVSAPYVIRSNDLQSFLTAMSLPCAHFDGSLRLKTGSQCRQTDHQQHDFALRSAMHPSIRVTLRREGPVTVFCAVQHGLNTQLRITRNDIFTSHAYEFDMFALTAHQTDSQILRPV